MKYLFVLIVVAIIGYVVYVNKSTPVSPEQQRANAMLGSKSVIEYYCSALMNGSAADMDSVSTDKNRGHNDSVIQALREEEKSLRTTAVEFVALMGGGMSSNVRDAKVIYRDSSENMVFVISVIRSEKLDNGEWRISHISID